MNLDPVILARGVHFAATVLAVGTVTFRALVADPAELRRRLNAMTWGALALAVVSGAAWLLLLASALTGEPVFAASGAWTLLTETRFGLVAAARLALAIVMAALIVRPRARWLTLAAAAGFVALLGCVGHAGAAPGLAGDLRLAGDVVHLLAAGAWLGGLPALALWLSEAIAEPARRESAAAAVRRFGWLGLICVVASIASGLFNAWSLLAGPRDLLTTDYGRLLLAKLGLVAAMLAIAALNRYRLTPNAADRLPALRRNSLTEAALGLGVLLLVGALGTLPPPAHRHSSTEIPPDATFTHIHDVAAMADVTLDPGRAGPVRVSIHVSREDGSDLPVKEVRLALDPPAPGIPSIERATVRQPNGTWLVERIDIPQPGLWTLRVLVIQPSGAVIVLDAPVAIGR